MRKLIFILICHFAIAQVYHSKEFSKEIALHRAKAFLIDSVFMEEKSLVKFEIDPLAATTSGELTSLVYKCEKLNKEGLLLGFFGSFWNKEGVVFQGYAYKNFSSKEAVDLLVEIQGIIYKNEKYLTDESNNIYFTFKDLTFLIYKSSSGLVIRVFWGSFDAEWQELAFRRTKRRFQDKIKN